MSSCVLSPDCMLLFGSFMLSHCTCPLAEGIFYNLQDSSPSPSLCPVVSLLFLSSPTAMHLSGHGGKGSFRVAPRLRAEGQAMNPQLLPVTNCAAALAFPSRSPRIPTPSISSPSNTMLVGAGVA